MWFFSRDEGACSAPKDIWNSMMLVHWCNTMEKYNYSATQYWADNWDSIPSSWRGNHPCYDPEKDLVLPAWEAPAPQDIMTKLWASVVMQAARGLAHPVLFQWQFLVQHLVDVLKAGIAYASARTWLRNLPHNQTRKEIWEDKLY